MKAKNAPQIPQGNFLYPDLLDHLNPRMPLLILSKKIPWDYFEKEFAQFYSEKGRPAKPIRLMVGLLLLKQIENLSDERVVEQWIMNPYYQAFCGMKSFQWKFPCEPSDLVHFRKRIGEDGIQKIFRMSVWLHGDNALENEIIIDTTVQEKNITFPTDTKLRLKVIDAAHNLTHENNISLRRSYIRELKKLKRIIRFNKSKKNKKKVDGAKRRIRTIANILLRELHRKLPDKVLQEKLPELQLYERVVNQKKNDKDKIYSLHEPGVACICKGKEHKKYEFGAKAAVATTKNGNIIVGVINASNEHDSKILPNILMQIEETTGKVPVKAFCDRGFRGKKQVGNTEICIPGTSKIQISNYQKQKARKNFGRRNAIEPIIGHLKHDFRMAHNYLKGKIGDSINLLLAATAFNCKKWMREAAARLFIIIFTFLTRQIFCAKYKPIKRYG